MLTFSHPSSMADIGDPARLLNHSSAILANATLNSLLINGSSFTPGDILLQNEGAAGDGGQSILLNAMECICSDLQHEDYSPLYAWFNYMVIIIMLPSLSVFGVLTNFVNVFIFSRKRMHNSSNTYLLFLSCSDFMVIVTGLFIFWIDSARSYIPELVSAPYTTVYTLPFGYMAQTCSIYFTVAAAFDCYVSVCWKRSSHHYCTTRRARQIVGSITLCSILYNSLRFPQFSLRKCFHDGTQDLVIEICPTSLFFTINTVYNVYMYMVLMTLLPFLLLLVLNALIIIQKSLDGAKNRKKCVNQKKKQRTIQNQNDTVSLRKELLLKQTELQAGSMPNSNFQKLEKGSQTTEFGRVARPPVVRAFTKSMSPQSRASSSHRSSLSSLAATSADDTITMIMVVVLFLSCNTLALIVNLIETFFEPDALLLNLLSDASNFLVIFNSSVNCVIYMIFNTEYREVFLIHFIQVKQYFRVRLCLGRKSTRDSLRTMPGGSTATVERYLYKSPNRVLGAADGLYIRDSRNNNGPMKLELNGHNFTGVRAGEGSFGCEKYYFARREDHSPVWLPSAHPWLLTANLTEDDLNRQYLLEERMHQDVHYKTVPISDTQQSFDPSNSEMLLVDDDSGWDESASTMVLPSPARHPIWLR
ncbi:7 transmembrane receptor (rhodopsin family) domain-containing protein [Ditylenchus destructor]|uniref:7 transmembrane receptor (Rhodopsin family) domain-containing protein n=1 Tax=Ditylenchus destructor TaxID=166010 RepID=A0AAD4NB60_9BILA|nr:7 transmembrane receptor (rhodopsin family) domain-containing protein [Ditylenchus destructor]